MEFSKCESRLLYRGRVCVPESNKLHLRLVQSQHDTPAEGPSGSAKTLKLVQRESYWTKMRGEVNQFIKTCHTSYRGKTVRHFIIRTPRPHSISEIPLADISTDFVTGLPWSNEFDTVCVVVDQLTKIQHLISYYSTIDTPEFGRLFIQHIFKLHRFLDIFISHRGPQFVSSYWETVCKRPHTE